MDAFGDGPVQGEAAQRLYSSAHDHMDCILKADAPSPPTPDDSRRRSRLLIIDGKRNLRRCFV